MSLQAIVFMVTSLFPNLLAGDASRALAGRIHKKRGGATLPPPGRRTRSIRGTRAASRTALSLALRARSAQAPASATSRPLASLWNDHRADEALRQLHRRLDVGERLL